jgi:hypothetical protein
MGMYSVMYLLPDQSSGFVMLTNGPGGDARTVMAQALLDALVTPAAARTAESYIAELASETNAPDQSRPPDTSERVAAVAGDLQQITGIWRDPWFGEIAICRQGGRLRFSAAKSPLLAGAIMRVGDRLLVDWEDDSVDAEAWLEFTGNDDDKPDQLRMAKVDPEADFSFDYEDLSFTRTGPCE